MIIYVRLLSTEFSESGVFLSDPAATANPIYPPLAAEWGNSQAVFASVANVVSEAR